jgi:endoglucanase
MNVDLLRRLTEAHGVPGQEDLIREIVRKELQGVCEMTTDRLGSLHCVKKGKGANPKKLMLAAHMDEIGFMVKFVDDKGFLRLQPLGGWDPRQMNAQRVLVHTKKGPLPGVLMASTKPKHMLSPEEASKPQQTDNFFVDLGMSGDDAKKKVRLGDMVTMNRQLQQMGKLLTNKCMDDRAAVYVMIEAVKAAKSHDVEIHAVATVQEEIGLRGAAASGSAIVPDIVVAIDITLANDIPGIPDTDHVTKLGEGTAIKIMDSSLICHPKLVEHFRSLAEKHKIKHQIEVLPFGGTDAGAVQRLHGGVPAFTLSIPTRYVHTVNETVHSDDMDASVELLARYIEDAHKGDYSYK